MKTELLIVAYALRVRSYAYVVSKIFAERKPTTVLVVQQLQRGACLCLLSPFHAAVQTHLRSATIADFARYRVGPCSKNVRAPMHRAMRLQ